MMRFKVPLFKRSKIIADDGFTVTIESWERLRYDRGELLLYVDIDVGGGTLRLIRTSLSPLNPETQGNLTSAQCSEILANIVDALTWRGWTVEQVD